MNAHSGPPPGGEPYWELKALIERLEKAIRQQKRMTAMNFVMFGYIIGTTLSEIIVRYFGPS